MKAKIALGLVVFFTALDIGLTILGLNKGYIYEANPLMRTVLNDFGLTVFVLLLLAYFFIILYWALDKVVWLNKVIYTLLTVKTFVLGLHLNIIINVFPAF